jgi:hypothetical protein
VSLRAKDGGRSFKFVYFHGSPNIYSKNNLCLESESEDTGLSLSISMAHQIFTLKLIYALCLSLRTLV